MLLMMAAIDDFGLLFILCACNVSVLYHKLPLGGHVSPMLTIVMVPT